MSSNNISIPNSALKYILLQRTNCFKNWIDLIFKYETAARIKSLFYKKQIKRNYVKEIVEEYVALNKYLPKHAKSLLDIGCGIGGPDVLISQHYNNKIEIYLLDKDEVSNSIYYGFRYNPSFYNSLQIAKELLIKNNINEEQIYMQQPTKANKILFKKKFDIIISLFAWGFHFPVSAYLKQVYSSLNPHGVVILDTRKGTNGKKEIMRKFKNLEVIADDDEAFRWVLRK